MSTPRCAEWILRSKHKTKQKNGWKQITKHTSYFFFPPNNHDKHLSQHMDCAQWTCHTGVLPHISLICSVLQLCVTPEFSPPNSKSCHWITVFCKDSGTEVVHGSVRHGPTLSFQSSTATSADGNSSCSTAWNKLKHPQLIAVTACLEYFFPWNYLDYHFLAQLPQLMGCPL